MSITSSEMTPADIRACTCGNDGGGGGMWGGDWFAYLLLFALLGGGGFGFGGFGGGGGILPWLLFGNGGFGFGGRGDCATQADLAAGFNNSAVLSNLNDLKFGQAQGFNGLNTAILQSNNGIDKAICTLGYQNQAGVNAITAQIAQCCCDIEKMNMQNRFDAQVYNCGTLQAIDKLGDRIIDYMSAEKTQALRDENQALRLAASQARQNQYLINELRPCPIPAYITCNPYAASYGFAGYGNNGCGCSGGGGF